MAPRDRSHLIIRQRARTEPYTSYQVGRGSPRPPSPIDRQAFGRGLASAARAALLNGIARRRRAGEDFRVDPSSIGIYVTFDSFPGFELALATLESSRGIRRPELVSVQTVQVGNKIVERATVYVPDGSMGYFIRRFDQYATQDTKTGKPKNANFVERIANLRLATIEAFWTDPPSTFPGPDERVWWEAWLRTSDGRERDRITAFAASIRAELNPRELVFDNRIIVLLLATARQLSTAIDLFDDLAELRRAKESAEFFDGLPADEQAEWVQDLAKRVIPPLPDSPAVCILDTGVNRGHPLL